MTALSASPNTALIPKDAKSYLYRDSLDTQISAH